MKVRDRGIGGDMLTGNQAEKSRHRRAMSHGTSLPLKFFPSSADAVPPSAALRLMPHNLHDLLHSSVDLVVGRLNLLDEASGDLFDGGVGNQRAGERRWGRFGSWRRGRRRGW